MTDDEFNDFNDDISKESLAVFEAYFKGQEIGFVDSDTIDFALDHYLLSGAFAKAEKCADLGIRFFPYNTLFFLRKAQAISSQGKFKEGLAILSNIEKQEATNAEFYLTKAAIFSQLKDSKRAISYFKKALSICETEDKNEIYLDIAMEYENLNDFNEAILILEEAIEYNPNNEAALYELAYCFERIADNERAIKSYEKYIDENPYSYSAWYNLGNAYSKIENYEKAIWAYDYCLIINESFTPALFNLGSAYLSSEKYNSAIEVFEKCLKIDEEDALCYCYIGESYEHLEQYEMAKLYYQKSVAIFPELAEAWLGLGIVEDLSGNTEVGIDFIQKAIHFDKKNGSYYHVLAEAYTKIELNFEAEEAYKQALHFDSENEEILIDYVKFLDKTLQIKELKLFLQDFQASEQQYPALALARIYFTYCFDKKENAYSELARFIEIFPLEAKNILVYFPLLKEDKNIVSLLP